MNDTASLEANEASLAGQSKEVLESVDREILALTGNMKWVPNPGPQTDAYRSLADVILYGGEPGGGKTDLILGLAFNEHKRALVMRRQYTDLGGIIDRMLALNGGKNGYNGSPPPSLKLPGTSIELGAAMKVGDEQHWIGRPRDLLGIDEATQFTEMQVRLLMGWVRSENPTQRCRTILATNPPLSSEGLWVVKMFAPWLDERFPNPAKPGELRWVVSDDDGDRWVEGSAPVLALIDGHQKLVTPMSRTYIPSSVRDNPAYVKSGYQKQLDALPAAIRQILMGGFRATFKDAPNQIIPTAWVRAAIARWTALPPEGVPMCAIGVDPSGGGDDPLALAPRYDAWYAPVIEIAGKNIPREKAGAFMASLVLTNRRDQALPVIDLGGGYGSAMYEHLVSNSVKVRVYKGAAKSLAKTKDGQIGFFNVRSEALWRFREALDPDQRGGSPIMLPDDPVLLADLTAPTFEVTSGGIKAEAKEDVCARLGRSTNRGDAVMQAWMDGPKAGSHLREWGIPGVSSEEMGGEPRRQVQAVIGRRHGR